MTKLSKNKKILFALLLLIVLASGCILQYVFGKGGDIVGKDNTNFLIMYVPIAVVAVLTIILGYYKGTYNPIDFSVVVFFIMISLVVITRSFIWALILAILIAIFLIWQRGRKEE